MSIIKLPSATKWLLCLASPFVFVSASHALTTSTTFEATSQQAGAYTIDFGASAANNATSVAGAAGAGDVIYSGSAQGNNFSYTDGALFSDSIPGMAYRPMGSTGNYLSVSGTGFTSAGPSTLSFSKGVSYFGFLWGSADSNDRVSFWNGNTELATFTRGVLAAFPTRGDQSTPRFLNVSTQGNEIITKVVFAKDGIAFETDNHAFVTAVPEPETYLMMLAGLGLMGAVARRRKPKQTV